MCFGRLRRTHAVVDAAVATMVPRTQAILRALLRRCLSGSRAAIALRRQRTAALLQRCCRAARRPNRWSSRSVRMLRRRNETASASIRALSLSAAIFFGSENPCRRVFSGLVLHEYSGEPLCPEKRYVATLTHSPKMVAATAFRGRRARLALLASSAQSPL